MNRIYQGRVTKVQRLKADAKGNKPEDWDDIENGDALLWRHHELFQDAVNYYLVCLLSLADDKTTDIYKLRKRITDPTNEAYQVWTSFRRRGTTRRGLRDSVAPYLGAGRSDVSFDDCGKVALIGNEETPALNDLALQELLHVCAGDSPIKNQGAWMLARFCKHDYAGGFPFDPAAAVRDAGEARLSSELHDIATDKGRDEFASQVEISWVVNLVKGGEPYAGDQARARLKKAVMHFLQAFGEEAGTQMGDRVGAWLKGQADAEKTLRDLLQAIGEIDESKLPSIPPNQRSIPDRLEACLLFKQFPSRFTQELLMVSFPRKTVDATDSTESDDALRFGRFGGDAIELARGRRGYVFRAFSSLSQWSGNDSPELSWKEFDIAAFKEALKALHQVESKGEERAKEAQKKQARLDYQWNAKGKWKGGGEQEEARPAKLVGDPRIARLKELQDELGDEYEMAEGQRVKYGLQARTIRGIHELRKQWSKFVKAGDKFSEAKQQSLVSVLRDYQKENPEMVGSVRLFETLLEEKNWLIWQEPTVNEMLGWRDVAGLAADAEFANEPVQALTDALELAEEVKRLREPVRLTPADAELSRRQFYFNDVCDLSKKGRFDAAARTLTVPVAVEQNEQVCSEVLRLHFGAARLLRDDLAPDAEEPARASQWQQPMMEALGVAAPLVEKGKPANLGSCVAVALMPDVAASGDKRVLLNFPVTLDESPVKEALGKSKIWTGQFGGADGEHYWLRWSSTWTEISKATPWWKQVSRFSVLSVDLGQRDAGAFALINATNDSTPTARSRRIGTDGEGRHWSAQVDAMGMLRLPGEDAKVWRDGEWQVELYGERGRSATLEEWDEAKMICADLGVEAEMVLGLDPERYSFPQMNDRLLFALRRAQTRLARLQSWSAVAEDASRRSRVQREIDALEDDPLMLKPAVAAVDWNAVTFILLPEIERLRGVIKSQLERIANRAQPLRGRHWEWVERSDGSGCHVLRQTSQGTDSKDKMLGGQRGLSMERLEQLDELRRRCLSLNRALQQTPGRKPVMGSRTKGAEVPDPCPELLEKTEALREQRVNQTAHLILAQALGLRLRAPQKDKALRARQDIHGEYERIPGRAPVDFIVMEDLARYLASQGRARSENTRLMKWCHRQILGKLKQLCEAYGISVLETPAAYSSRFCSRTGIAGFRAVDLPPEACEDFRWKKHLVRLQAEAAGEKRLKPDERAESVHVKALLDQLAAINKDEAESGNKRPKWRTLLAPVAGGPIFVPAKGSATQADMNAAINLGFRAIAAPDVDDIHVRLRSERKTERFLVRAENTREKARWKGKELGIVFDAADQRGAKSLLTESHPNFFADVGGVAAFDRAAVGSLRVASGRSLWRTINDNDWFIVNRLNNDRLEKWGCGRPLDEGKAKAAPPRLHDHDDEIPDLGANSPER